MYINKILLYSLIIITSLNQNTQDNINVEINTIDNVITKKKKKQLVLIEKKKILLNQLLCSLMFNTPLNNINVELNTINNIITKEKKQEFVLVDTKKLLFGTIKEDFMGHILKDNYQNKEVEWIHTYIYLIHHPKYFTGWIKYIFLYIIHALCITFFMEMCMCIVLLPNENQPQQIGVYKTINMRDIVFIIYFTYTLLQDLYIIKIYKNKPFCRNYLIKILKYQFLRLIILIFIVFFLRLINFGNIKDNIEIRDCIISILSSFCFWFLYTLRNNRIIKPSMDQIKMCEFTVANNQLLIPKENEVLLINLQKFI